MTTEWPTVSPWDGNYETYYKDGEVYKLHEVSELLGKTMANVERGESEYCGDEIRFTCDDGKRFVLFHSQDCCESVSIEDVNGDLQDLVGHPLLMAEEAVNPPESPKSPDASYEHSTWTFYKFATAKGYVTIRWYGESNGYYSESVSFAEVVGGL